MIINQAAVDPMPQGLSISGSPTLKHEVEDLHISYPTQYVS